MYSLVIWDPGMKRWENAGGVFSDFAAAARRADLLERATGIRHSVRDRV